MALVVDPKRDEQLAWAIDFLKSDQPVALPTETVYGLAGRVYSDLALGRIFSLKARPHFDPLIAHVNGVDMARDLCTTMGDIELELMRCFWPGPLTILCKKSSRVSDLCTGGSPLVAVRSPADAVFSKVISLVGEPLAAPSANRFQGISPTSYRDVLQELGPHGLSAVVDGGNCQLGIESTVVKVNCENKTLEIWRHGACAAEHLDLFAVERNLKLVNAVSVLDEKSAQHSPGQLAKHYSPTKDLIFVNREWVDSVALVQANRYKAEDLFLFVTLADFEIAKSMGFAEAKRTVVLGKGKSEAAAALFKTMRTFDADNRYKRLVSFAPSLDGVGAAIADRLQRAAVK